MSKSGQPKLCVLLVGPQNAGKTKISNYMGDLSITLPDGISYTKPLRIVEYEHNNATLKNGTISDVDVELWDTCAEDKYMVYWSAYRKYAECIVFVYNEDDYTSAKKLDVMYNYFISQTNFSLRRCLVCCIPSQDGSLATKLSPQFSKISKISANLEINGEKFKNEFGKFISNVLKL